MLSSRKIAPLCQQGRRFLCGRVTAQSVWSKASGQARGYRAGRGAPRFCAGRTDGRLAGGCVACLFWDAGRRGDRTSCPRQKRLACTAGGRGESRCGAQGAEGGAASGKERPGREVPGGYSFCSALRMASAFFFPMPGSSMSLASVAAFMSATESKCSHSRRAVSLPMPGSC